MRMLILMTPDLFLQKIGGHFIYTAYCVRCLKKTYIYVIINKKCK